jgi:hypothetical protein
MPPSARRRCGLDEIEVVVQRNVEQRRHIEMNTTNKGSVHWDPYNPKYFANPYPAFRQLLARQI